MRKQITAAVLITVLIASFLGCSKSEPNPPGNPMQSDEKDFSLSLLSDSLDRDSIFTNRDISAKYDDNVFSIHLKDNASSSDNDGVIIKDNTITITSSGTYVISGKLKDGQLRIHGDQYDKIQLVLDGVHISNISLPAIHIIEAKKVFITASDNSKNYLSVSEEFVKDEYNADGVIYSKQDLSLNGGGELSVDSAYGHAIVCNDDLTFAGGKYTIKAGKHCIKAHDSISIASGEFNLTAGKDALHCDNSKDSDKGNIYIQSADFNINAEDDAMQASGYFITDDGNIHIENSDEGIEAHFIEINGGNINIKSSDDGMNAANGSSTQENTDGNAEKNRNDPFDCDESCYINIAGGEITVDAEGDGLDSNGYIQQTGGSVIVYGPENSGNSALDYGASAKITGGSMLAFGFNGMAQGFSSFSTQGAMLISFDQESDEDFVLKDEKDNVIVSRNTAKKYNAVVVSTKDISEGKTYTAYAGSQSKTIEMTGITYNDSANGFGKKFGGGKSPDGRQEPPDNMNHMQGEPPQMRN